MTRYLVSLALGKWKSNPQGKYQKTSIKMEKIDNASV